MSEESPTVFGGRYELHRRLARGGMADVFQARDQLLGRPVAVKVLFPEFAADPKFVERFRREAQSAANLNHPNIVSIYDWGEEMGTYYIVMEFVEGQSLAQILRRDGRLSAEQVTRVALDVSAALGFAHEGDVVHRDVKPGNVLVSPKGEMKVADFGIATALTSTDSNLTQTGAVMGTATYFSPEQAQGHKVDARSDLYSLGVVMYEMLTGKPPFSGETPVSIAYKHVQEAVPPVSEQGVDIPPALAAICMKLLSKNPNNRYPDAAALRADLDRFRQGQAIAAANASAATAAGAARPAAVGQTTAMPAQQRVPAATARYVEPPRRRGGLVVVGLLTALLILAGFLVLAGSSIFGSNNTGGGGTEQPTAEVVQQLSVPSVGGRGETDGRSILESQGFGVDVRRIADDNVAAGTIITTEPAAGSNRLPGTVITMVVSSGPNAAQVPPLLTLNENQALQRLTDAGFKPSINRISSNFAPEGEVISQVPEPGTILTLGETVTIEVSAGIETLPIPDVRGAGLDGARSFLESEGFIVDTEFEWRTDEELPRETVVGTVPPAGGLLAPGGSVRIVLSDGPDQLIMPDVLGFPRPLAKPELESFGLRVLELGKVVTDPQQVGIVVDTIPPPNAAIEAGIEVQVYIGLPIQGQTPGQGQNNGQGQNTGQGQDQGQGQGTGNGFDNTP